jgi:hypothetical protein
MIGSSGPEKETRAMNQEQKVIRVNVGVLELAKQLGNVTFIINWRTSFNGARKRPRRYSTNSTGD